MQHIFLSPCVGVYLSGTSLRLSLILCLIKPWRGWNRDSQHGNTLQRYKKGSPPYMHGSFWDGIYMFTYILWEVAKMSSLTDSWVVKYTVSRDCRRLCSCGWCRAGPNWPEEYLAWGHVRQMIGRCKRRSFIANPITWFPLFPSNCLAVTFHKALIGTAA